MGDSACTAVAFRSKVRAGDLSKVREMLKDGVDYAQPGKTLREWTPLHMACWGSTKPQNDREIVELILMAASKDGKGKAEEVRNAKDAKDGSTPADLAKERRDALVGGSSDEKELDEKRGALAKRRKLDKIIEWLEKGLAAS